MLFRSAAYRPLSSGDILVEVWPTRRWIGDHLRQLRRSIELPIRAGWRASYDTGARSELRTVFGHYADHWRRIGRSVAAKLRR